MHPHPALRPARPTITLLAILLAACGGAEPETSPADDRARSLAAGPAVIAPLFDEEGNVVPASDSAQPADDGARTRQGHYATPAQAEQLEHVLRDSSIAVRVEPGPDAAASVELAVQTVRGHQAAHALPAEAPVLVHSYDLRLGAAAVHQLQAAGHTRVFLVTR